MKEKTSAQIGREIREKVLNGTLGSEPRRVEVRMRQDYTNAERLAYYRAHGLQSCDDYPGGDAQFEQDVLSGQFHATYVTDSPMLREDSYVCAAMYAGTFKFDWLFRDYFAHPKLLLAYYENAHKNGFCEYTDYPGGPMLFKIDIELGIYAKKENDVW